MYGFECCFLSAHCVEGQARTSDNVKSCLFNSVLVQWWSFIDKVVYCNILRSFKAAFVELEKPMLTVATVVLMLIIITPGHYTQSKQSMTFHAKCNLKVNFWEKMSLTTKSDWFSVTILNHTVRHKCHVVDVCSTLLK